MRPSSHTSRFAAASPAAHSHLTESRLITGLLIAVALGYLGLFLLVPVLAVFAKALEHGLATYWAAISDPLALAAIRLTVITAAIAVPLNTLFGLAASWVVAKFDFPGKNVLLTVIDLPFSVSPVITGLLFVLLFGAQGVFGT